ncbi:MAG: acyl-ACP--UDP-N-acetylglucosamine O-acyltransferase [Candidatus Tectimicrobiota bacterium]
MSIHSTVVIDPAAKLGADVTVGPYAVIEADVTVGDGSSIGAHVVLHTGCRLGRGVVVAPHVVLGGVPQHLDFRGHPSEVVIGDGTVIREFVTVHRSLKEGGETRMGRGCFLMAVCHVAHDCQLGDGVILTSYVGLSGHVIMGDRVVVGGHTAFHQFVRVGQLAMVSGTSRVVKDVPPYFLAEGNPCRIRGLNVVGLRRAGMPAAMRDDLKRAFRLLYRSGLSVSHALEAIRDEFGPHEAIDHLVAFIEASERGLTPGVKRGEKEEA